MSVTTDARAADAQAREAVALRARATRALSLSLDHRRAQFWVLQVTGWFGLCVLTFLSLTLWYNTVALVYIQHTLLQAALGLLLSLVMRAAFRRARDRSLQARALLSAGIVGAAALVWTALRIVTFMAMTGERGVWADFGGWYFASLLILTCWTLAYYGVKTYQLVLKERERSARMRTTAAQERLARMNAERLRQDAHLRMLRYQINPHFLFNTLNSVTALIETDRNAAASEMVGELSRFLRTTLRENDALRSTVGEEIEALRLYLGIERKRFGDRLQVEIGVDASARDALLPSLLLQPLVENSIKHAVARSPDPTTVTIRIRRTGDTLDMLVGDTGGAAPTDEALASRGVGLANVEERLQAEYGDRAAVASGRTPTGGWRTTITMPAETAPAMGNAA